jgi:hypothetical protein
MILFVPFLDWQSRESEVLELSMHSLVFTPHAAWHSLITPILAADPLALH